VRYARYARVRYARYARVRYARVRYARYARVRYARVRYARYARVRYARRRQCTAAAMRGCGNARNRPVASGPPVSAAFRAGQTVRHRPQNTDCRLRARPLEFETLERSI
jgi:hypothetical protein